MLVAAPAALLVHCSSFGTSNEPADAGAEAALVEGGSPDASSTDFCARVDSGLKCEDFERNGALDDPAYQLKNQVRLESPGFQSAHGIVASADAGSNAFLFVPSTLSANAKHVVISAAIRLDARPDGEVDLLAVGIGGRTLELYVKTDLALSFASCKGPTCEDQAVGLRALQPGAYGRVELSLDLTGPLVLVRATLDGDTAFASPITVSAPVSGATFSSSFGIGYTAASVSVHVDDLRIEAD